MNRLIFNRYFSYGARRITIKTQRNTPVFTIPSEEAFIMNVAAKKIVDRFYGQKETGAAGEYAAAVKPVTPQAAGARRDITRERWFWDRLAVIS
jgi:hypothetical protein